MCGNEPSITDASESKKQIYQECLATNGFNQNQILILFFTHRNIFISLDFCGTHFEHQWCQFYHFI